MIPQYISFVWQGLSPSLKNHLWQSTLFLIVAALLTLILRKNQARTRYWLWLAASIKFLVPFSLLITLGSHLAVPHRAMETQPSVYFAMDELSQPFTPEVAPQILPAAISRTPSPGLAHLLQRLLAAAWFAGFAVTLCVWCVYWRRVSAALRVAVSIGEGRELETLRCLMQLGEVRGQIKLLSSASCMEPGIFGIFRPALIWPAEMSQRLGDRHLEAILAHEVCHVRRRDNLTAAIHMSVEAIFWFHPLVWWLGARLVEERERACDEEVLHLCKQPEVYAEGILKVCEFCLESPLPCVSGVTGSDLKKRIVNILANHMTLRLDLWKKLLLLTVGLVAIGVPILLGQVGAAQRIMMAAVNSAPLTLAQKSAAPAISPMAPDADPTLEVATVKPADPNASKGTFRIGGHRIYIESETVSDLISVAYSIHQEQITNAPPWLETARFDIEGQADIEGVPNLHQVQEMLQKLLEDRFDLKFHREKRELSIYAITVAKGGPKLAKSPRTRIALPAQTGNGSGGQQVRKFTNNSMSDFALGMQAFLDRPVVDETGLTGRYNFVLKWTPDESNASDPNAPPGIFTAVQQQLGLKLEPTKGPADILVIDRVERSSPN